jgi:UDP-N-acetylglucosamine--N-acetylmuramyl-(pentapeptide) pyrophosphoryl-undecaprenol N-acetylglucosamine transferase
MFPAQALARELLSRRYRVTLITDRRGSGFGPELPQIQTHRINAVGMAGSGFVQQVAGAGQLALGFVQALRVLRTLRPETVVGFGGYASVPAVLAGRRLGMAIVLHEQNAVLGRANRLLARHAHVIATSFSEVAHLAPRNRDKVTLTGNPVRPTIAALGRRPYAVPGVGEPLRLLVVGGSQGAAVFNELVPEAICRLPEGLRRRLQISQQVRGDNLDLVRARYADCGIQPTLATFFEDIPQRLGAADLIVCRAGASTVAELTAAGRPAILVPYPFATDDHQTFNARALAEAGGGWLMPQSALTVEALAERLDSLLSTPVTLTHAARCAHAFGHQDAAKRLADLVCNAPTNDNSDGRRDDPADPRRGEAAA